MTIVPINYHFQKSQFRRYDVSNVGEVLEQSGGTYTRTYGTVGHGKEENGTVIESNVTEVHYHTSIGSDTDNLFAKIP